MKQNRFKNFIATSLLFFLALFFTFAYLSIFVRGVAVKNNMDDFNVVAKIKELQPDHKSIDRTSFKFVTYTCEDETSYTIYDIEGKVIAKREKAALDFDKVKALIEKNYPQYKDMKIQVGYGREEVAFLLEDGVHLLVINASTYKTEFHLEDLW